MTSVLIEEVYFAKYNRIGQFIALFLVCMVESIWYKQVSTYWRMRGLLKYLRGDRSWNHLERLGFAPRK